jgi:hypothetical protein
VRRATRELAQRFSELNAARDPPILDGFLIGVGWLGAWCGDATLALQAHATALEHREATGYTMDDDSPEASAERVTLQFLGEAADPGQLAERREQVRGSGHGPALHALVHRVLAARTQPRSRDARSQGEAR